MNEELPEALEDWLAFRTVIPKTQVRAQFVVMYKQLKAAQNKITDLEKAIKDLKK